MSHEPGTVGKFAGQRANRQMVPLRRYLRLLAVEASSEARQDRGSGRAGQESSNVRKELKEGG